MAGRAQTKAELAGNDAVTDDLAAAAYVENFALKIFGQADNEDRTAKATRCVLVWGRRPGVGRSWAMGRER